MTQTPTNPDQPVDELLYKYAPDITDVQHIKLRQAIQAECNRARLSEARYVENYFDGEAFYPDEWQRRIAELQQLMKEGE